MANEQVVVSEEVLHVFRDIAKQIKEIFIDYKKITIFIIAPQM